jgi:hypothetical protein
MRSIIILLALCCVAYAGDLPDSSLTPGQADPTLTKEKLCSKTFRTGSVRNVPQSVRTAAFKEYGITCPTTGPKSCAKLYELDHLIDLWNGGSNDLKNLWPQSRTNTIWSAGVKDRLELRLHKVMCSGTMSLDDSQTCISKDWIACYQRVFSTSQPAKR